MARETALVTGASSGIGKELAVLFAQNGYDLVLVARNDQALDELAHQLVLQHGVDVTVLPKDLSLPQSPDEIYEALEAASVTVDILVNNAGMQVYGRLHETDAAAQRALIQVNLVALSNLTLLFLPGMVARGHGRILNLGSTGSFAPAPLNAPYCATKAYVLSFSEGLARDLQGTGVTVTCLCPGATDTDFANRAGIQNTRYFRWGMMDARAVARAGYRALMRGRTTVVPGLFNKLMVLSIRLTPRRWVTAVGEVLMGRTG